MSKFRILRDAVLASIVGKIIKKLAQNLQSIVF